MENLNIPVTDIKLSKLTCNDFAYSTDKPFKWSNITFSLLSANGKKIGEYEIKIHYSNTPELPPYVQAAMRNLIHELEKWGAQEAINELNLIEAPNGEEEEDE